MILVDIHTLKIIVSMELMNRLKEFQDFCVDYMDFDIDPEFEYCWERMIEFDEEEDEFTTIEYYLIEKNQTNDFELIVNDCGGVWNMIQKIKEHYCPFKMKNILNELFIFTIDEPDFHFKLLTFYYNNVFLPVVKFNIESRFIFYRRLHYNRFLKDSSLPDDICSMIREFL